MQPPPEPAIASSPTPAARRSARRWVQRTAAADPARLSRSGVVVAAVAAGVGILAWLGTLVGPLDTAHGGVAVVGGQAAAAAAAALAARAARLHASGVSSRVWRLFSIGLLSWALGCIAYIAFLLAGGDPQDPAAWTQIGFLGAYPFWYRALWLLRQPVVAHTPGQRLETIAIEITAVGLAAVVVGGALWMPGLDAGQNVALLLPAVLDVLLVAALYNAIRRSALSRQEAQAWLGAAFVTLCATDIVMNYVVPRGHVKAGGGVLAGYALAMGLFAAASGRPIRLTEAQSGLGRSTAAVAALALALVAPAGVMLPSVARPVVWGAAAGLVIWLGARIRLDGQSDVDALTGLLRPEAFERHLAGTLASANDERRAALILADIQRFAEWTAEHGFAAADAHLAATAGRLIRLDLPDAGVWTRLGADRFAWLGIVRDLEHARRLALQVAGAAGRESDGLSAQAGIALVPGDADTTEDALAAAEEAMLAARASGRRVVAFDCGHLDGIRADTRYTTTVRRRQARIRAIIADLGALEPAFQPIVSLETGRVTGYEALSRFHWEPAQGPDKWIAEADAVGLGLELEAECLKRAAARRGEVPPGAYLALNASPELLLSPALDEALGRGDLTGIVFEITEHHHVADYAELADRLARLRGRGARIAIDDVGAGHSSMRHVMNLRPDYVKVDRWLVDGIHLDSAKRALLRSLVALAAELRAELIVEGVETLEELATLRELGVTVAQGYLFARPQAGFATPLGLPRGPLAGTRPASDDPPRAPRAAALHSAE
jgi:EAL domain-containing protein (putative c-di-GMP-specific phosphodiesterase class I)/GGDEF domain-containing protein